MLSTRWAAHHHRCLATHSVLSVACRDDASHASAVHRAISSVTEVLESVTSANRNVTLGLDIKASVHVGPAVAAVVGVQRPKYNVFGSAHDVLMALLDAAVPQSLLMSPDAAQLLRVRSAAVRSPGARACAAAGIGDDSALSAITISYHRAHDTQCVRHLRVAAD